MEERLNVRSAWLKNNIPDQSGKTVIVTGANSGISYETALALCEYGAHDQDGGLRGFPVRADIAPIALDEKINRRLWSLAELVSGIHFSANN